MTASPTTNGRVSPLGRARCPRCAKPGDPSDCGIVTLMQCRDEQPCAWMKPPESWTDLDEMVMVVDRLMVAVEYLARAAEQCTSYQRTRWCARIAEPWHDRRIMVPACRVIQASTLRVQGITRAICNHQSSTPCAVGHWLVRAAVWIVTRVHSRRAAATRSM